jgi:hypothetical protein
MSPKNTLKKGKKRKTFQNYIIKHITHAQVVSVIEREGDFDC